MNKCEHTRPKAIIHLHIVMVVIKGNVILLHTNKKKLNVNNDPEEEEETWFLGLSVSPFGEGEVNLLAIH